MWCSRVECRAHLVLRLRQAVQAFWTYGFRLFGADDDACAAPALLDIEAYRRVVVEGSATRSHLAVRIMSTTLKTGLGERIIPNDLAAGKFESLPIISLAKLRSPVLEERQQLAGKNAETSTFARADDHLARSS